MTAPPLPPAALPARPPGPLLATPLDRTGRTPLATQIYRAVREAIEGGRLAPGARLPSWRDLAAQLGVARGTVRVAYQRLADEQFVVGLGAAGTRVADRPAGRSGRAASTAPIAPAPLPEAFRGPGAAPAWDGGRGFGAAPLAFQMGVPAQDAFPFKLWSRLMARAARRAAAVPVGYPDPRGDPALRQAIAAYLALARGVACAPDQVFVTAGYAGALNLAIRALRLEGAGAWVEDPSFPLTRNALALAGLTLSAAPVDAEGLDVAAGVKIAPDAALAVVTPGQHAPLGMTLSLARRLALIAWARERGAWIIEDDYLSELQLTGRAAPALASLDHGPSGQGGRVLHLGSFSKTLSPALRLGFLVAPPALAPRLAEVAAALCPAPAPVIQGAVAELLAEGHYLRHLRRMKRLYAARRQRLVAALGEVGTARLGVDATAGMAVVVALPPSASDVEIARRAHAIGLAPTPLSPWYVSAPARQGLLLGVTNVDERRVAQDCRRLAGLVDG